MSERNFEQAMEELKSVVSMLDREDVGLDQAIELYKKGIELSKECKIKLEDAQKMVKSVIDENGNETELTDEY